MQQNDDFIKTSYGAHCPKEDTYCGFYDFSQKRYPYLTIDIDGVCLVGQLGSDDWCIVRNHELGFNKLLIRLYSPAALLPPGETRRTLTSLLRSGVTVRVISQERTLATFCPAEAIIALPNFITTEPNYDVIYIECYGTWLEGPGIRR